MVPLPSAHKVILMKARFAISLSMAVVLAVVASIVSGMMPAGAQGQVPATGNIAVRDGSQPGEVIISWDAVPEATHYRIGYVNMETDYPLAKASRTGNWLEAFVYVDVEAQNFTVVGGRTEYTVRRLGQGVRHAFTVRTSDNVDGAFTWPSNPRWRFHVVSDRGGACPTVAAATTSSTTVQTSANQSDDMDWRGWRLRQSVNDWGSGTPWNIVAMSSGVSRVTAQGIVPATGNIAVRDGSQPGEVIISWDAVPEATHYRIGYVNMETDYPLAKASRTGNWLEAFVYVDVEAQNFTVVGGRTEYTVRRLGQGVRHAFTVRTSDNVDGAFTWPSNPRWRFHVVSDRGGACPTVTPAPTPEPAVDRAALVALYNATDGANWTDNTNWLSSAPLNGWHGVTTNDGGRVTRLTLRENDLTGTIPSVLGRLTSLERLDLQGNDLTGSIPGELVNLNNLQRLDLDYNQLTGALPSWLGNLGNLQILDLNDNLLTGEIPAALGNLAKLELIQLRGNALTGCVPEALQRVADNDLDQLGLPSCGVPRAQEFNTTQLEALFDDIISKTERREAFSEVKESNIGFSAIGDMKKLRSEFVASRTETELYYALWKLSNARRDAHLWVGTVDGGLQAPDRASCVSAPIHVLPDLSDILSPTFFVAEVGEGLTSPKVGDVIVGVNGRSMAEYMNEFTPWIRHSSLHGLYWRMAYQLPTQVSTVPPSLYSGQLDLTLENSSGQRYDVTLPYSGVCQGFDLMARYPGFDEVMKRENFNVLLDRSRQMILLQWLDFERNELIKDIPALMEYAERARILDYDMIIDVTWSGGGSGGAYAIQRLVDRPFRVTFGNVRLSDLGKARIERYVGREPNTDAPDIFGLNLSRSWLIDWARTDATEAIRRGDEYTPSVPFKLAHLPKDSDGILQPAPVHFSGEVAVINARTWGGSHLDQFMAMYVDNDVATFIGMPTGGYSNTWEGDEVLVLPETGRPLVRFLWSIGHTIRPNGEVLEGNPALPDNYVPITRDNFQGYHQMLLYTVIAAFDSANLG